MDKIHSYGNVEGSLLPPSIIVDIYKNPDYLANMLKQLKFVAYVGGALPAEVGNPISTGLKLLTMLGSTENLFYPIDMDYDDEDWDYIPVSPLLGHEYRPARDGLSELVFVRDQKFDILQGVFATFPDLDEYHSNDLFEKHPTKPYSWVFRARADDIICFSNAEKLNPVTMEGIITAHPAVNAAVIGGHGEFQASLLIEPKEDQTTEHARQRLLDDIWPTILQANRGCPAHGRIMKEFVMFTKPEKPLPRAGKHTIQRFSAMKLYAAEFKELYANPRTGAKVDSENGSKPTRDTKSASPAIDVSLTDLDEHIERALEKILPKALSQHLGPAFAQLVAKLFSSEIPYKEEADLKTALYHIISDTTYVEGLSDSIDLFEAGLDSLQLPALINEINAYLIKHRRFLSLPHSRFSHWNFSHFSC